MPLFKPGPFLSHSGLTLPWKLDCDALSEDDWWALAEIIAEKIKFGIVIGVPSGGLKLGRALTPYAEAHNPTILIVDDVLTTGSSMESKKQEFGLIREPNVRGLVLFSRGGAQERTLHWVQALWTLGEWARP